jgi:D-glycerate 3-kinase
MPIVNDDKAQYVIPFIIGLYEEHQVAHALSSSPPPLFVGLNGVQGAGKSVLVEILSSVLSAPPYGLDTIVFSLDDLYLTHVDQVKLSKANIDNPLLQHRGQPSTHDIPLALTVFSSLKANKTTKIPVFNKSLFSGQGDRVPESEWKTVNSSGSKPPRIVIFEGWSVGFQSLTKEELEAKHSAAAEDMKRSTPERPYVGQLGHNTLASIATINESLKKYEQLTSQLDGLVYINAENPQFVYTWRLEQEAGLRALHGSGMTDEQVKRFIDGYYPAYELYKDALRRGVFRSAIQDQRNGMARQLELVVGPDRRVKRTVLI